MILLLIRDLGSGERQALFSCPCGADLGTDGSNKSRRSSSNDKCQDDEPTVKMRDRARASSLFGRTRPELLYCKIGVFMAAASDKTDHVWKRRGCAEIESRGRGGEEETRGEEEQRAKVSGKTREGGRAGKESMKWKHNGMQPRRTRGGRRRRRLVTVFP